MKISKYAQLVDQFGGPRPYEDADGRRFNLRHRVHFPPSAVRTDGVGNIIEMPLLPDKPCFGRPERFVRGSHDPAIPPLTGRNDTPEWRLSRCQRCPIEEAYAGVVEERIGSCPVIAARFAEWDDAIVGLPDKKHFEGRVGRRWTAFLLAIKRHGGWENVNDANVAEAEFAAALDVAAKQKKKKKQNRLTEKAKRTGQGGVATLEFLNAVEQERQRRAQTLLDLRKKPHIVRHLPHISRLKPEGCERTADVWAAHTILAASCGRVTGKMVAEYLIRHGRNQGAGLSTLTTWVYKDLGRIYKLERDHAGVTIWQPFAVHPDVHAGQRSPPPYKRNLIKRASSASVKRYLFFLLFSLTHHTRRARNEEGCEASRLHAEGGQTSESARALPHAEGVHGSGERDSKQARPLRLRAGTRCQAELLFACAPLRLKHLRLPSCFLGCPAGHADRHYPF